MVAGVELALNRSTNNRGTIMKKTLAFVAAGIAAAAILGAAPAMAHDDANWSVTIGSPGYPPPVVYGPPRVVYERVEPVVVERRTAVRYGRPYGYREGEWRDGYRGDDRHGRRDWDERRHHHGHDRYRYDY
jgi:hypothetical protein